MNVRKLLWSPILLLALLGVSLAAHAGNLTVSVGNRKGELSTAKNQASLEAALTGAALGDVVSIEISGGEVTENDWKWLGKAKDELTALRHFEVKTSVGSVADIPDVGTNDEIFSGQIESLTVAKVKRIGKQAFSGCDGLRKALFPDLLHVGELAFAGCTGLSDVQMPSVETIAGGAFGRCDALESVIFPKAKKLEKHAFANCKLLKTVQLAEVQAVEEETFMRCTNLQRVELPKATKVAKKAFANCDMALREIYLPQATEVGEEAFLNCLSLEVASLPNVRFIGVNAFRQCVKLASLRLGPTPPTIVGSETFENCPTVRWLVPIDAAGTRLKDTPLDNALKAFKEAHGGNPNDEEWHGFELKKTLEVTPKSSLVGGSIRSLRYYPAGVKVKPEPIAEASYSYVEGSMRCYAAQSPKTEVKIEADGTFTMPHYDVEVACEFKKNKLTVSINNAPAVEVESLAAAFAGELANARSVEVSKGTFAEEAWLWLRQNREALASLREFVISESVAQVADIPPTTPAYPYFGKSLKTIRVAKISSIGESALQGCSNLVEALFPSVKAIGGNAFAECSSLTKTNLLKAEYIASKAFADCSSLRELRLPLANTIHGSAFERCESLKNLALGATPPTVEEGWLTFLPNEQIYLIPIDADGNRLEEPMRAGALAAYKAAKDNKPDDDKWFIFELPPQTFRVTQKAQGGEISVATYFPADATVTFSLLPNSGHRLVDGSLKAVYKEGGKEKTIPIADGKFKMPGADVKIICTFERNEMEVSINGNAPQKVGSLEEAIGTRYASVNRLDVIKGKFTDIDWRWLYAKRKELSSLKFFSIGSQMASVAEIPSIKGGESFFAESIESISIAKIKSVHAAALSYHKNLKTATFTDATHIGSNAFAECESLIEVKLPRAIELGELAFSNCKVLSKLQLGAVPPTVKAGYFANCPEKRLLELIAEDLTPLTGDRLGAAIEAYKKAEDGNTTDPLWYGWSFIAGQPIKTSVWAGGDLSTLPSISAQPGMEVTIVIEPKPGFKLKPGSLKATYKKNGQTATLEIKSNKFVMPSAEVEVTCEFEAIAYTVTCASTPHGAVKADPTQASAGQMVSVQATPEAGYKLKPGSLKATYEQDGQTSAVEIKENIFSMPAANVVVVCEFEPLVGPQYTITCTGTPHGKLETDVPQASEGQLITVNAVPDAGYNLKPGSLKVIYKKDGQAKAIEVVENKFSMPAANVEVTGEFEPAQATAVEASTIIPLRLHPNPASRHAIAEGLEEGTAVGVYSLTGQRVKALRLPASGEIDLAGLKDGMYVVEAAGKVGKLVVRH